MSLLEICQWIQGTEIGTAIRESTYVFPVVEGTHLLSLGFSVGLIMITDLRLMGVAFRKESMNTLMRQLLPWSAAGFAMMLATGFLLFWSEAETLYESTWFRWKVVFLLLAAVNIVVFHLTVYRTMDQWDRDWTPPRAARLAGLLSLVLWALVIVAGRSTAYNL